jgi:hypothetical protein
MKISLLLIAFTATIYCRESAAQKIEENKIDEFTKNSIKRTSWDILVYKFNGSMYLHTRMSAINDSYYLDVKYLCQGGCSIGQGAELMLKLENDSIVSYKIPEGKVSCRGCGSTGIVGEDKDGLDLSFPISKDNLKLLSTQKAKKIRLYLSGGYVEGDISSSNAKSLAKQAFLILN